MPSPLRRGAIGGAPAAAIVVPLARLLVLRTRFPSVATALGALVAPLLLASCTADRVTATAGARDAASEVRPSAVGTGVRINEVESNGGVPGDWVELYNDGDAPVDLSGYVFRDNDDSRGYVLPAGTVIPARGFLVLDERANGVGNFDFGLGAADAARLFRPDGTTLVDTYAWTAHAATTYGRCPDGTGAFATTSLSTKGAANDCAVLVRINEVESSGGVPGDWVELYNPSDAPVDLSGYVFRDDDDTRGYTLPAGTTIAARGHLVLEEAQFGFGLGGADAARLFRPNGTTLVDAHAWTTHATTTYGRCPDGVGTFVTTAVSTKGAPNACAAATATVRVNEVESSGGVPGDWVELVNTGAAPVDLSGYVFRDNDDTRGYVLPAGTVIPANGFLVLEEAQFGFGLGAADAARLFAPGGATLVDAHTWTAHAATTYGRCPDGTGAFRTTTQVTKGTANDCAVALRINEVESSGGTPGDWIELVNAGPTPLDVGGYVLRDDNDATGYVLPVGTTIAAGGYLVVEEAQLGFGLGGADAARLFAPGGTALVDAHAWTTHATTTYGRCPNGSGPFATTTAPTKGAANACAGDLVVGAWPGDATVTAADAGNVFGGNMSGLSYQPLAGQATGVVWAVRNGPGTLFRLTFVNGVWTPRATRTWANGKALRYPDGTGDVDAEGVVVVGGSAYVASERNNAASGTSRNAILLYDVATESGATLVARREWNLTADLPANGPNLGLEAITFVPDAYLVARGLADESRGGTPYDPANYPNARGGLFLVGVEATGAIHAYALDHATGGFTRVATFASGYPGIMELAFDAELGQLWAVCDDTCNGRSAVLRIDAQAGSPTRGRFVVTQRFERPAGMPNLNNEGFTLAPLAECVGGRRPALWADDGETGGIALRRGSVTCSPF